MRIAGREPQPHPWSGERDRLECRPSLVVCPLKSAERFNKLSGRSRFPDRTARTLTQRQGARTLIERRSAVWLFDDHGRRKAATVELEECASRDDTSIMFSCVGPKACRTHGYTGSAASARSFRHLSQEPHDTRWRRHAGEGASVRITTSLSRRYSRSRSWSPARA